MKIQGNQTWRTKPFDELLQVVAESQHRCKLLRTIHFSEHYTDGIMLTRLLSKEKELVDKIHYDTLVTDSKYKETEPYDVGQGAIPKYLRKQFRKATLVGDGKLRYWRLEGEGVSVAIYEKPFIAFVSRIKSLMSGTDIFTNTSWWFSKKKGPVVVIDEGSFSRGRLLGTIAIILEEKKEEDNIGERKLKRIHKSNGWYYKKIEIEKKED